MPSVLSQYAAKNQRTGRIEMNVFIPCTHFGGAAKVPAPPKKRNLIP
jgi:hypothetical protein